jgi:hypothetical protein
MTTFTVQVKDSDAEMVLTILKKFKAKVIESPKESELTLEIAEALKEVKLMRDGKLRPLSLKDLQWPIRLFIHLFLSGRQRV